MAKKAVSTKKVQIKKEKPKKPEKAVSAKPVAIKSAATKTIAVTKQSKVTPAVLKKPEEAKKLELKKTSAQAKAPASKQVADNTEKIKIDRDSMSDEQIKWAEMYNKFKDTQASLYDMKATFKAGIPIQHKVLGWGWVVSNDNDRLEVLFKDGKRILISNYRG